MYEWVSPNKDKDGIIVLLLRESHLSEKIGNMFVLGKVVATGEEGGLEGRRPGSSSFWQDPFVHP